MSKKMKTKNKQASFLQNKNAVEVINELSTPPVKKEAKEKINALSIKQMVVLSWWTFDSPFRNKDGIICDGSVRSGKTWAMSLSFILWAMANFNECDFIMAGKTISALMRNVISPLKKRLINRGYRVSISKSDNLLMVQGSTSTNTFYFFGGKDEASQNVVQGLTAAGAYFDEVALMPESFVNQATARCSVDGAKLWFNCNPENPDHYFKLEWVDKIKEKNFIHMHFTMDDNPGLSDERKAFYNKLYTGVFHDRMIKGLWRRASGLIYRRYADKPSDFIVAECKERLITLSVGVDFGGSKSATAFIATGFTSNFKSLYILDEKVITREINPDELNEEFVNFINDLYNKYRMPITVRCDSAEPVLIRGLQNAAIKNRCQCVIRNAFKKSINDRIHAEQILFGDEKIKILSHCKEIQLAFLNAVWDEKHPDERLDEVGPTNPVDRLDAFEYSFEEYLQMLVDLSVLRDNKKVL